METLLSLIILILIVIAIADCNTKPRGWRESHRRVKRKLDKEQQ